MLKIISVFISFAILTIAAPPGLAMTASLRWCSGSPEFKLSEVPKATVKLRFLMRDLNAPSYPHGGGEFAYAGQATIPCRGLKGDYEGPSPPPGTVHTYEWTIEALDGAGSTLTKTTVTKKFPQ